MTGSLRAEGITVRYDRGPAVLSELSFAVPAGQITGLAGPSGRGKSTLARTLAGLIIPESGAVTIDGEPVPTRRGRMDGRIALLGQSPRLAVSPRMTLRQIITEPSGSDDRLASDAAAVGLTPELLDRRPGQVSDGQLQRACLARALGQRPRYLLADEPTAMLDTATTATIAHVLGRLADSGVGVLTISHDRALLDAMCDRVHAW